MPLPMADRLDSIRPFQVMRLLGRARDLEAAGRDIVHMEIGEPDFPTAGPLVTAAVESLRLGTTGYTPAAGLPALRAAIAGHYARCSGVDVSPERIIVTPGGSGALMIALALLLDAGQRVLLPDPGYPCNRNFVLHLDGIPVAVPVGPEQGFQPGVADLARHWQSDCVAAMVGSPSNPTGTIIDEARLAELHDWLADRGAALVVDEIYHGLSYARELRSVLALRDSAFVVNSFSKYFGMTGWRLGWLVVPPGYEEPATRLAQNLYIAASTPAQHAALACFTPAARTIFEERRQAFRERRDFLLPALEEAGFRIPARPDGAFYIYADCSGLSMDAATLSEGLLEEAGVALTPGLDFGSHDTANFIRVAYTSDLARLRLGVERIREWLGRARPY